MERSFLKKLDYWLDRVSIYMHALASIWMFFLIFIITCDVAGRVLLNRPIPGVPEVIKASLVFIAFLLLPEATGKMRHIRSDVMANRLGPSLTRMLAIVRFLLGMLLLTGIAAATWDKMIEAWKIWEYEGEGTIRVPMAPVRTTIFICSAIAAVLYFRLLGKVFKLFPRDDRTK
jgi:TRAP-type C4-dicarboxylate transport system permease small subunit